MNQKTKYDNKNIREFSSLTFFMIRSCAFSWRFTRFVSIFWYKNLNLKNVHLIPLFETTGVLVRWWTKLKLKERTSVFWDLQIEFLIKVVILKNLSFICFYHISKTVWIFVFWLVELTLIFITLSSKILVSNRRSYILKQTCCFQLQVCFSICDLLVGTWQ